MASKQLSEETTRVLHGVRLAILGYSHAACVQALTEALRSVQKQSGIREVPKNEDQGFVQGVAYAVAELIRRDEMTVAHEIWEAAIGTKSVPRWVADFDAAPIRRAIKRGWV